jgi:hypothetical protein
MKAIPYIIAAAVVSLVYYLWTQLKLWQCAMTGSTEVYAGSVVSPSMQCAAQLGLYGLSYDSSTGGIGIGSLPDPDEYQAEVAASKVAAGAAATGDDQSALEAVVEWAQETFKPWEDVGMSKDDWCNGDLPTQAQRFAHCDVLTWF